MKALRTSTLWLAVLAASLSPACATPAKKSIASKSSADRADLERLKRDIGKIDKSIEVTKELIRKSKGERYLPDLYFRLAELYIEKSRAVYFRILEEAGADDKTAVVAPEARLLKDQAIGVYRRILAEFPEYIDNDKITFFIAHEYRELGLYQEMTRTYEDLIQKYPKSNFRFEAWLVLGDTSFDKGNIDDAILHYRSILKAPETYAHNMARYKLGWCYINKDKPGMAVDLWEQAVRTPTPAEPGLEATDTAQAKPNRLEVRQEALRDLAYYYTEARDPKSALAYFQELTSSRQEYRMVLERLGRRFSIKTMYEQSAEVYRELIRISADVDRNLEWAQGVYEAAVAAKALDHADDDVVMIAEASARFKYWWRASEDEKKVLADFELLTRDLSTRLHAQAKERSDDELYARTARAYEAYLSVFDDNAQAQAIQWNFADALFSAKRYIKAGRQYERVLDNLEGSKSVKVTSAPKPASKAAPVAATAVGSRQTGDSNSDRRQAMYAAILAYFEALKVEEKGTRFDSMMAREGIKDLGARFVASYPDDANAATVKFNVARAYYEQGLFDKAITLFVAFAKEHPSHRDATTAAELTLDAYAQKEDFSGLAKQARAFSNEGRFGDGATRQRFAKMADQAEQEEINRKTISAEGNVTKALASFVVEKKGSEVAAKALYQAFVIAKDRRNLADMLSTGRQLLDDYGATPMARDVLPALADQSLRVSQLEQAATYYEDYARRFPQAESADALLEGAATIRTELGEFSTAVADYDRLIKQGDANKRSQYWASLAQVAAKAGDWRRVEEAALHAADDPAHVVLGNALAGEAALRLGKLDVAGERLSAAANAPKGKGQRDGPEWLARAQYLLGEVVRHDFERVQFGAKGQDDAVVLKQKFELLQELEGAYVAAIQVGDPEFAMGGLYRVANAYKATADFLDSAPAPANASIEDEKAFRAALAERSGPLRKQAADALESCRGKARDLEAFNRFTRACVTGGAVDEAGDTPKPRPAGVAIPGRAAFEQKLVENPKDLQTLVQLVRAALMVNDYPLAKLLASRALEIDERHAELENLQGVALVGANDMQAAAAAFKRALRHNPRLTEASVNLGTLYALHGDSRRAGEMWSRLGSFDAGSVAVLPQYKQARELVK